MNADSNQILDPSVIASSRRDALLHAPGGDDERINILLVDDERKNLLVLQSVLENPRYRLVCAESADEALLALVTQEFALLVLDIQMPDMNGFELAKMIKQRKKTSRVPIIFLTAYFSEDQHVLEGYGTGAVNYLHKPINPTVLRSKVAVFADLHVKSRELEVANHALVIEVEEHRQAREDLRKLTQELEKRVVERTTELGKSNEALTASEERLKLAVRNSRILLYATDRELRYTWISNADPHFVSEQAIGKRDDEIFSPQEAAPLIEIKSRVLESGFGERAETCREIDGNEHYYSLTVEPLSDRAGGRIGLTVAAMDITELKQAEAVLKHADRQKDEFLATLAHELRNPLAPICNAVQILHLDDLPQSDQDWAVDVIDRQTRQMTRLVNDLLDISRITTGKLVLRKELVELKDVFQAAVETSRPLIDECGQQLVVIPPSEPVFLHADVTRLAQVLSNLLNNAAKYSERGGHISLTAQLEGERVSVSVKDTGTGISAEMLPHVFEMFTQGNPHWDRSQSGLGIGLTLVKRLVELHEGTIEAHSEGPKKGSEFVVCLPRVAEPSAGSEQEGGSAMPALPPRLRILVADDNQDSSDSLRLLLSAMGHDVRAAHDGLAAVEAAAEFRPDVALLDIGMPRLNGYEACRRIRQEAWGKGIVLIAQTGWGQEDDRRRTCEAGFDHHLVKPVSRTALLSALAKCTVNGGLA